MLQEGVISSSTTKEKRVLINGEITSATVRLIDEEGKQLGVVPTREALHMATERELDLVEVSPNADPPVCRIMDFGKFKYQQNKRKAEAKKKQTVILVKEVKLRLKTETNDVNTKVKHLLRFIEEGHKVKVSVVFYGREITHPELAVRLLNGIMENISSEVQIESQPRMEGRAMVMMVGPKVDK